MIAPYAFRLAYERIADACLYGRRHAMMPPPIIGFHSAPHYWSPRLAARRRAHGKLAATILSGRESRLTARRAYYSASRHFFHGAPPAAAKRWVVVARAAYLTWRRLIACHAVAEDFREPRDIAARRHFEARP